MKTIAVFFALVAVALAAPQQQQQQQQQQQVYVVNENPSNNIGLDSYQFGYELSDGQKREESAQVESRAADPEPVNILRVRGSFSYVADDGQTYTVNYVADENGYRAEGAHLPVA